MLDCMPASNSLLIAAISGAGALWLWWRMTPKSAASRIGRKNQAIRKDTLIPLLHEHMVPMEKIEKDYPELTKIVRVLIGIIPRCDAYLEIWPTAFRTYNLIVPNFMNVPFKQLGVGPGWSEGSALAGLAMYVVSRTAECSYCSAHTCSYALRRGTSTKAVIAGVGGREVVLWRLSEAESAVVSVARGLGKIPCELTDSERDNLVAAVGSKVAEAVVFSACAMGYLNKVMDSFGVELEEDSYLETRDLIGQDYAYSKVGSMLNSSSKGSGAPKKDSLWRKLSLLPLTPGAILFSGKYQRGVPDTWPAVGAYLKDQVGFDFPLLSTLGTSFVSKRAIVAVATAMRENLDASTSIVSLPVKTMAAVVFTCVVCPDSSLAGDAAALAIAHGVTAAQIESCRRMAAAPVRSAAGPEVDPAIAALGSTGTCWLLLARAVAPSPAQVTEELVGTLQKEGVAAAGVVEVVNFVAVWQLLLRVDAFFRRREVSSGRNSGPDTAATGSWTHYT